MPQITIRPLTPNRWHDFELVMGPNGACVGCWCAYWRVPRKDYVAGSGARNKARYRKLVEAGPPPGLIAYVDGEPAAWAQVCPRADLPTLDRSRFFKPVDDKPVWSISCFFVRRGFRGMNLTAALVKQAQVFAKKNGATMLEAYPWKTEGKKSAPVIYTGVASTFAKLGFDIVAARAAHRPIMRKRLGR
jgi:GNAT superfamily N-acetyltransferase